MGAELQTTNVLFLCVGNSIRSQMAEVVARARLGEKAEVRSAGVIDAGVDSTARLLLEERGYNCDGLYSKVATPDLVRWAAVLVDLTVFAHHSKRVEGQVFASLNCPVFDPVAFSDQPITEDVRRAYLRTLSEVEEMVEGLRFNFEEPP